MTLDELGLQGVTQTILGRGPDFGEACGNCMQAAIATALGARLEDVPHFLADGPVDGWWERCNEWLLTHHGVALLGIAAGDWTPPAAVHLMQGRTVRGSSHVVVGFGGELLFDPHPNRDGLIEVEAHELFVAARPGRASHRSRGRRR